MEYAKNVVTLISTLHIYIHIHITHYTIYATTCECVWWWHAGEKTHSTAADPDFCVLMYQCAQSHRAASFARRVYIVLG